MSSEVRYCVIDEMQALEIKGAAITPPSVVSETSATGYSAIDLIDTDLSKIWRSDTAATDKEIIWDLASTATFLPRDFLAIVDPYFSDYAAASAVTAIELYRGAAAGGPWTLINSVTGADAYGALETGRMIVIKYPAREATPHDQYLRIVWRVASAVQVGASKLILGEAKTTDEMGYRPQSPIRYGWIDRDFVNEMDSGARRRYKRPGRRYITMRYKYVDDADAITLANHKIFTNDSENKLVVFLDWANNLQALGQHRYSVYCERDGSFDFQLQNAFNLTQKMAADLVLSFVEIL